MSIVTGVFILMLFFVLRFGVPFAATILLGRQMRIYDGSVAIATGT